MWEKVKNYIEGYINQTHMESLTIFENLLQQSLHLEFLPEKLTKYSSEGVLNKKTSPSLQVGLNKSSSISIIILRSIHSNNFTFLMTSEKLPVYDINRFIFIVVVWPKEGQMINRWKEELSLNMWVTVRQPYKADRDDDIIYLVVRLQNLVIQQGKRWKQKSQSVKQKANVLYKKQQYMQAFTMYEFALCNNHQHHKNRQRAILYANSAACLFEMRLFSSSVIYCDLAIKCDPSYPKGHFRKISSLLQGSKYSTIPGCLLKLKTLISNPQFEPINQKYTNYMTNDIGIYNWGDVFKKADKQKVCEFGEYHSNKIQIRKTQKGEFYVARQDIMQYELILVNKPLVHVRVMNETKKNFEVILDQVKKNCLLQKEFYQMMKICPPRTFQKQKQQQSQQPRTYNFPQKNASKVQETLTDDQLIQKLELSLMMERHIDEIRDEIGYGLWKDSFYLPLQCDGNCTYVHLKLAFVVWASRNIKKGEILNIDYLSGVQGLKRLQIMQMKYHRQCECMYCTLKMWPQNYIGDIEGLYDLIDNLPDNKTRKQMICQIIIKKANNQTEVCMYDGLFPGIIYRYMIFIQKDPQWQDIINLMGILRDQQDKQLVSSLTKCVMHCLNKYLKIHYSQQDFFEKEISQNQSEK